MDTQSVPESPVAPQSSARRGPVQPANKLDQRITRVWRIHEGIALVVIALIAACVVGGMYVGGVFASNFAVAFWVSFVAIAVTLAQLIEFAVVPSIRYARWRYEVTTTDVLIRSGLVVVKTSVIPMVRVQHVETKQGPVLKANGLASVTVTTAGSSFEIPGLATDEAEALRDQVAVLARIAQEDV